MDKLVTDLIAILGKERVLFEPEHLAVYGFDGTAAISGSTSCVVFPQTTDEVAQIVKYAAARKLPVVTRGSGTGLSGGSIPQHGSVVRSALLRALWQWPRAAISGRSTRLVPRHLRRRPQRKSRRR